MLALRLTLRLKYPFLFMPHKRTFLALEYHAAGFEAFDGMPHALGDVHTIAAVGDAEDDGFDERAVVVIG